MNDVEHIPVKPNINNSQPKVKKNILENIKDPEVQQVLNKKKDVFNIESMKTKEEQVVIKADTSSSWLIVVLAIIIVILIIVVIYYVLKYNAVSSAAAIPVNIVKPINHDGYLHNFSQQSIHQPPIIQMTNIEKPKKFVEPTKKDLDDVLQRLSDNNSPKIQEIKDEDEVNKVNEDNKSDIASNDSTNGSVFAPSNEREENNELEENKIKIDKKIEELIMSDDNLDNDIIDDDIEDEFRKSILED